MTGVLRVSLAVGGLAIVTLGVLAVVASTEGADGPTRLLGVIGHIWETTFTVALVPILVAMSLVCRATRSVGSWVIAAFSALVLGAAAVVAILRLAGAIDVFLPLANWLPGTVLMTIWGWVAARAAVHAGFLQRAMSRAAGVALIAQITLVGLAGSAVLVSGTNSPGINIAAGVATGGIWVAVGVWWLAGAARWRGLEPPKTI